MGGGRGLPVDLDRENPRGYHLGARTVETPIETAPSTRTVLTAPAALNDGRSLLRSSPEPKPAGPNDTLSRAATRWARSREAAGGGSPDGASPDGTTPSHSSSGSPARLRKRKTATFGPPTAGEIAPPLVRPDRRPGSFPGPTARTAAGGGGKLGGLRLPARDRHLRQRFPGSDRHRRLLGERHCRGRRYQGPPPPNRVGGRVSPPPTTSAGVRIRTGRFTEERRTRPRDP